MSNTINTNVHTGTFTKADGSKRTMRFVRWNDIPASYKGTSSSRHSGDSETVYDVEANGFRSFNNKTLVGSITTVMESVTFK
tara:strand:+ start:63 stop:308 length:246 start_codon:yes stop_codon:yes gene_type:complete